MEETVKLEVDLAPLRERTLFIATPAYGGGMHSNYVRSLVDLQRTLMQYGIGHTIQFMYNESLIPRARNKLADMFLQSGSTDLMFIDADIEFAASDVILLMHYNKSVIGGSYPLKSIAWDRVKAAVLKNPDIDPAELPKAGSTWSAHCFQGKVDMPAFTPIEVPELATGFLMVKKEVFEAIKPLVPTFEPASNDPGSSNPMYDFFRVGVHSNRYESEDYSFCRTYRESGGKVHLCPWIKLTHHGSIGFEGNMTGAAQLLGEIH